MKFFKSEGLWFLPDDLENKVAGTLDFAASGITLKLLGGFQGGWSPVAQDYPAVRGTVGRSPYGDFVTLYDGFQTQKSLATVGIGSEKIKAQRAYIGDDFVDENVEGIASLHFDTTYLHEWIGSGAPSGFEGTLPGTKELVVRYHASDPLRFDADDASILAGIYAGTHGSLSESGIRVRARLSITPRSSSKPMEIIHKYANVFRNMLTFATDIPNAFEEVTLISTAEMRAPRARFTYIHDDVMENKEKRKHVSENDMLFTMRDAHSAGVNVFQGWLKFAQDYRAFCEAYFSLLYAPPRFVDEKFSRLLSAFTLLCEKRCEQLPQTSGFLGEVNAALKRSFAENSEFLEHVVPTGRQVEMPLHLMRLLSENSHLMRQIVGEDFAAFVRSISNTLSVIESRAEDSDRPHLHGAGQFYGMEKIRVLIKIMVLKTLGFDEQMIANNIGRNSWFNFLKSV